MTWDCERVPRRERRRLERSRRDARRVPRHPSRVVPSQGYEAKATRRLRRGGAHRQRHPPRAPPCAPQRSIHGHRRRFRHRLRRRYAGVARRCTGRTPERPLAARAQPLGSRPCVLGVHVAAGPRCEHCSVGAIADSRRGEDMTGLRNDGPQQGHPLSRSPGSPVSSVSSASSVRSSLGRSSGVTVGDSSSGGVGR
jgi:hypothetical protein